MLPRNHVLHLVDKERDRQEEKWGVQRNDPLHWVGILFEEGGEAAQRALQLESTQVAEADGVFADDAKQELVRELIHVAAVAVAAIEDLGGH